ncbi:MAG: sulfur oxidation c-type cytochrome SoxX [Rhodocyclaceae bacterium]|jgi:sulfur-oxidizing protein SoxX|uniref:Sulfur oxidation c-type cytochrome SoxX n=1 Tax=Candidatus Desulfobacillus denitrificans TaxID=2608985 RepID=A0A809R1Z3_9PROT|nr:sulfur oxidation c-type cytochrome SoxX [Candidatus Desulfobacillus denitrificans]GIK47203.1 MAG: sulfur oxidation c-type cytochrome SoxX [Betaproteobacteria bacterium]GJQ56004.1 MAG: sulfur oxidation c-type cytochrome SoxX [Rhodocyclaceae bacterium]
MNKILFFLAASLAGTVALADGDYRAEAIAMMKHDFKTKGIATADRVNEDGVQAVCNRSGDHPPKTIAERLEKDQLESIRYPADGKLMGDWKAGEKLAQSGRGMTWSDKAGVPGGGNCYNCHQIGPAETSFGTVGPSLYQFGKLRGSGPDMQKYVYGRIWNAKAFNLCSAMPRFGHVQALTEAQIKDLVALLLDPQSPVNSK